jgi:hypothetical protein
MKGVISIPLSTYADSRGTLVAPQGHSLPFEASNFFYIRDVPPFESRGNHSSCSDEALIVILGSLTVDLDNGEEKKSFMLQPSRDLLCVHAGVYLRLHTFEPNTILVVLASMPYNQNSRLNHPQPDLVGNGWENHQQ